MLQVKIASDGNAEGVQCADDQVNHGVGQTRGVAQHRSLHFHPKQLPQCEFNYFPYGSNGESEAERKKFNKAWPQMQIDTGRFIQHVHQQETEDS